MKVLSIVFVLLACSSIAAIQDNQADTDSILNEGNSVTITAVDRAGSETNPELVEIRMVLEAYSEYPEVLKTIFTAKRDLPPIFPCLWPNCENWSRSWIDSWCLDPSAEEYAGCEECNMMAEYLNQNCRGCFGLPVNPWPIEEPCGEK